MPRSAPDRRPFFIPRTATDWPSRQLGSSVWQPLTGLLGQLPLRSGERRLAPVSVPLKASAVGSFPADLPHPPSLDVHFARVPLAPSSCTRETPTMLDGIALPLDRFSALQMY